MSGKKYKRRRQSNRVLGGLLCVCVAALLVLISVLLFQVDGYKVRGSYHQRDEEVVESLMQGTLGHNSLYLALTNRGRKVSGNTFIDTVTVNMKGPRNIEVVVEEKPLVGYVYFDDHYWYFDRTGMVRVLSKYSQADYNRMMRNGLPLPENEDPSPANAEENNPAAQDTPAAAAGDASVSGSGGTGPTAGPAAEGETTAGPGAEGGSTAGPTAGAASGPGASGDTPASGTAGETTGSAVSGETPAQAEGSAAESGGREGESSGADVIAPQELTAFFVTALTPPVYFGEYEGSEEETELYSEESYYGETDSYSEDGLSSGEDYSDSSDESGNDYEESSDYSGDTEDYSDDSSGEGYDSGSDYSGDESEGDSSGEDYDSGSDDSVDESEGESSGEDYDSESDYSGDESEGESSGEDYDSGSDYSEESAEEDSSESQETETITFEEADDVIAPVVITGEETSDAGRETESQTQPETPARSTAEDMLKSESGAVLTYIPLIEGLSFDRIEVGKTVPGQNSRVFDMLETFQSFVVKTGDVPDRIVVGDKLDLSVFYGGAEVRLGTGDYLDERLSELKYIHPHLAGLTGILHLENFDGTQDEVIFSKK